MSLLIVKADIDIIVSNCDGHAKRLAQVPFDDIDRPEDTFSQRAVLCGEVFESCGASMETKLQHHTGYESTQTRSCIVSQHRDEEKLDRNRGLNGLDRRCRFQSLLYAFNRDVVGWKHQISRDSGQILIPDLMSLPSVS